MRQGAGLILVDPPMINGEKYEFQAIRDSQLVKNVSEVMLCSLQTDAELLRQILVRIASNDVCYDLHLTGGNTEVSSGL